MSFRSGGRENLVLFRTHQDTPRMRERLEYLYRTSDCHVICLFDESYGHGFSDKERLAVGPRVFDQLGLGDDPRMAWRCGDYCYYAARIAFPEIQYFWLIEYDVMLSYKRASDFFSQFAQARDVDYLAAYVGPAPKWWDWAKLMSDNQPVYRSFFPVTRLSARAIDFCFNARQQMLASFCKEIEQWPNDEVFVATTLARAGFIIKDLNDVAKVYNRTSFNFSVPRSYEQEAKKIRRRILHPVLDEQELALKPHSTLPRTPFHAAKRLLYAALWE